MTEVHFAEPQSLKLTHDKPSNTSLITRDSGFQEIDVKMMNGKIEIETKPLIDKKPQNKNEAGLLDPWGNDASDQDYTKSIKFNKSNSKTDNPAVDDDIEHVTKEPDDNVEASLTIDSLIFDSLGDEKTIALDASLSEEEKREKITRIFTRAASNGSLEKVSSMLETSRQYIDIDAQDEEGTTPLIYAACFGHESVAFTLLEAGAKVDAKDSNGWTPLIWAANNSHDAVVKLLLDHGADATAETANRRTVFHFMTPEQNPKIVEIFSHDPKRDSWSTIDSVRWSWDPSDNKLVEQMAETEMKKRMLIESAYNLEVDMASLGLDELEAKEEEDDDEQLLSEFIWHMCLPDQMFVFSSEDIPHILKTVILDMQPIRSKIQKPVPANIIFLSARFAHYYSSSELLESFLFAVIDAIDQSIKARPEDMTLLSFWISNCTLLLYYLKKDAGLAIATVEYQLRISELLHEIYVLLVKDAQRRIDKTLEASVLEFDTIPGLDDVRFEGEWRVFKHFSRRPKSPVNGFSAGVNLPTTTNLKRSSSTNSMLPIFRSPPSPRQRSAPSPRNVTSLLSSTLFVLQTYEIHPMIIEQVMNQLFYFISCELFNKILSKKKYLCRSKAMQIRLNISAIEDWVHTNNLSLSLITHFQPLIQLLQLLMCWSQMTDFLILVQTTKELNLINPAQLKRVSKNYRYEVNEPRITEECQQYILQLEEDTERRKKRYSTESIRSDRSDASSIIYLTVSPTLPPCGTGPGWEEDEDLMEMKDSELLLPFAIPTSTEMLANYGGQEKENEFIPLVPDDWMEKLDVGMRHGPSTVVEELTSQWEAEYNEEDDDDDYQMDSDLQIGV